MPSEHSTLTPAEASAALDTIRQVELQTRRAIGLSGGGPIMMIWGFAWLVGFLGGHWLDGPAEGALWAVVDLFGFAGTAVVVARIGQRVRDPGGGRRIGLFWISLLVFTALLVWLVRPQLDAELGLLISLCMMFGYVTMGVFVDRVFLWVGVAVSALAVGGYLLLPAAFGIWMAVLGGGALFGCGLYVHRRWR